MSVLLRLEKPLDSLSDRLEVAKLSSFYDHSELEAAYDPGGEGICRPCWFDSASGLEAVVTLRSILEKDFTTLGWVPETSEEHWPAALLDGLRWCERVLEEAVAKGREFRLLIVP